jgi:hypothetical protein
MAFYDIDFLDTGNNIPRQDIYMTVFQKLIKDFGYFLDGYFRDLEFVAVLISQSMNSKLYRKYFISQISRYDTVLIFYYLLSNHATKEFARFIIEIGLLKDLYSYNAMLIDLPNQTQIDLEIQNISQMYEVS